MVSWSAAIEACKTTGVKPLALLWNVFGQPELFPLLAAGQTANEYLERAYQLRDRALAKRAQRRSPA